MTFTLIDGIGWVGSLCVIIAYGLNSYQKVRSDSMIFYTLNLIGGILLIIYSNYKGAYANTFINVVWVIIAIPAMLKVVFKSKAT
jgi:hypothetical protein